MAFLVFSIFNIGFGQTLTAMLLMLTSFSWSSPIKSVESQRRTSLGVDVEDDSLFSAGGFLSQFLYTLNFTRPKYQTKPLAAHKEPLPEYMLELYNRYANDQTIVPSANIVRGFKNEDFTPYSVRSSGVRIHPLMFNISVPHREHITLAELRLFTLVLKTQRAFSGLDYKVTIYKIHEGVVWTKEVGKERRGRDKEEVVEMKDLEELWTQHVRAEDNSWVSFDLTHAVKIWQKSGCATHELEVHIAHLGSENERVTQEVGEEGDRLAEINFDRSPEGKHNAVLIVFSDDQKQNRKQERKDLNHMTQQNNNLPDGMGKSSQSSWERANPSDDHANLDELDEQSVMQLQSNLIYDTPPRIRRNVKSTSCRRTPLFVDFKDIGWDSWIIQPLGYEAYKCNGVCNPPLTSEVSPTKHAIVQTRLSVASPERASRACCVPTKLEPISLLYHDNGVITFNHKYEGMVVAECGCR